MQRHGFRYKDHLTGTVLDVWYPKDEQIQHRSCPAVMAGLVDMDEIDIDMPAADTPPTSVEDTYLRLHLLSECQRRPNQQNLEGIFEQLTTVAWTSAGPVLPERVDVLRSYCSENHHHLTIFAIDKFPRMVDYVVPDGVRIGDADRVRLGAHLCAGTTVMHEGFVNFNAGTIGPAMIEGRVTPGVTVGTGSDIGAGSSIMGTLSGGGKQTNSVGERSLLGANAGIGISLGDECVVEAGLYVTAGTKVRLANGEVVAARTLSGQSGLLYRRNSQAGCVEAVSSAGVHWGGLNQSLHQAD